MPYYFYYFGYALVPILLIGLIIFFVSRRHKKVHASEDKDWYLRFSLSKEDSVSQLFLLLSVAFLSLTLLAFNRDLHGPLSWQTVILINSLVSLLCAYRYKAVYPLILGLVGFVSWWGAQAVNWSKLADNQEIKSSVIYIGFALLALLFYALGHLHEKEIKYKRFALVYSILGIISLSSILFLFSTKPGLNFFSDSLSGVSVFGSFPLVISFVIFLVGIFGATLYSHSKKLIFPFETAAIFILTAFFGLILFLPEQNLYLNQSGHYYSNDLLSGAGMVWALVFNLMVFVQILGVIISGYLRKESWLVNLGAFFLFLLIIVKYFDWFFSFLDKSVFFIGAGIILFLVGWFMEKGRRYVLRDIKPAAK